MLPVSANWKSAIKEQFRYQGYLKVTIKVTPPGLQENISVLSSDTDTVSTTESITDDMTDVAPYASLESNRWLLNGAFDILEDDTVTDDWWSVPVTSEHPVTIDFEFDKTYSIPGIYAEWDTLNNTYPINIAITGYDASGAELSTVTVTDISSATGFVEVPFDNVLKVRFVIYEWNVTNWRARISELLFGLYAKFDSINRGKIASATSIDSANPLSSELPTHTVKVSLRNEDKELDPTLQTGLAKYLAQRQKITYQWGFTTALGTVEWTPNLIYYVDEFNVPEDSKEATISATSKLAFLDDEYKLSPYDGSRRTLFDVATEVLTASSIIREETNESPWQLSETLKNFYTNAPVPNLAVNTILQYIASASMCLLHTDFVTGDVALTEFQSLLTDENTTQISTAQELGDPAYSVQEQLFTLSIGVYAYTQSADKTELSRNEYIISGETVLNIDYNVDTAKGVTCSVSGATLISFTPYGSSCVVVVKPSSGSTATATVTISGYEVKKSVTYVETYRDSSLTHGLAIKIDNPFITETSNLAMLSEWFVSWYQKRQKISIPYTGYPELTAGDTVELQTVYGNSSGTVCSATLDFNGGFDGDLEVW